MVRLSDNNGTDGSAKRTGCVGTRRNGVRALFFRPNPLLILFTQLYMSSSSLRYIVSNITHIHTHTHQSEEKEWRMKWIEKAKGEKSEWVQRTQTPLALWQKVACRNQSTKCSSNALFISWTRYVGATTLCILSLLGGIEQFWMTSTTRKYDGKSLLLFTIPYSAIRWMGKVYTQRAYCCVGLRFLLP